MDIVISVLVFVCLILIIVLIGGKGNYVHSDTKEIVYRVHEYFQSEYDDAKNVSQVGLQQTSSNPRPPKHSASQSASRGISALSAVTGPTPTGPPTKPTDILSPANFHNSDPVTKAVMDNIMGKLPTKKQVVTSKCDICGLEFSGQVVLETHLAGAKHAKKVKSQEILKQLQSSGQTFTRDEKTRILKCEVCDVVVNSSQQLQTHLAGNKHKQKALKKGALANNAQKPAQTSTTSATTTSTTATIGTNTTNGKGPDAADAEMECTPTTTATTTTTTTTTGEVPPGVQKLPEASGAKTNKYFCDTCNVSLNSEIQLEQHLGSRKHKDKLLNGGRSKPRMAPYWKKPRMGYQQSGKPNKLPMALQYSQPLSNNFVSGGAMM